MDKHYKLLLVDDDEDEYIILKDLLYDIPGKQYDLTWVIHYSQAIDHLRSAVFDVALVDYRLGPDSGIELLQQAIQEGLKTPIIILTGQEQREVDEQAMQAGAADYLVKGQFDINQLERAIRYTVERQRTQEKLLENEQQMALQIETLAQQNEKQLTFIENIANTLQMILSKPENSEKDFAEIKQILTTLIAFYEHQSL